MNLDDILKGDHLPKAKSYWAVHTSLTGPYIIFIFFFSYQKRLKSKTEIAHIHLISWTPCADGLIPLALVACFMDSTVCGLTPSSAATTRTTTSVILAPLARMVSNAAWPGVSINVIVFSAPGTWTIKNEDKNEMMIIIFKLHVKVTG